MFGLTGALESATKCLLPSMGCLACGLSFAGSSICASLARPTKSKLPAGIHHVMRCGGKPPSSIAVEFAFWVCILT